jgi:DNA processing protein
MTTPPPIRSWPTNTAPTDTPRPDAACPDAVRADAACPDAVPADSAPGDFLSAAATAAPQPAVPVSPAAESSGPEPVTHAPADVGPASGARCPAGTASPVPDQVLLARAYLLRVAEPPAPALATLAARIGAVRAAALVRAGDVPTAVAEETRARRDVDHAEQDLAEAAAIGAQLLVPEDPRWPVWPFAALDVAAARGASWAGQPLALWVRGTGDLAELTERAVALVGARAATAYGEQAAAELAHGLGVRGFTIVSGAAYGIDAFAHRGALAAGAPTVAVLGCGIAVSYPAGHATLLRRIAETGAVISEYPPGIAPARHRFLVRNRLIAALSGGSLVVEAGRRSGARNTAATAAALGRTVLAVPGPITSAMSIGCHELIRTGDAMLAGGLDDVLEAVGRLGEGLTDRPVDDRRETDGLDALALRVYESLTTCSARSAEQVSVISGVPLQRVRAVLPALELRGLVRHVDGGWRAVDTTARKRTKVTNGCGDA